MKTIDISKYRDKSYLVTYELTTDIFDAFGVKVDEIVPVRSVYIIDTDMGTKVLKKINYSFEELQFVNSVINYINKNGFSYAVPFAKTTDGSYYLKRDEGIYVMLDTIAGREVDFQNPGDMDIISKALCKFHKATEGFNTALEGRNNLFLLLPRFIKQSEDMQRFRGIAEFHEIKTDFDELFLKFSGCHHNQADRAVQLLKESDYEKLCYETLEKGNICHHDLASHNIVINDGGSVYFADFDSCMLDLRVHDLINLITKSIRDFNWDFDMADRIISGYCSVDELRKEEIEVMYGMLTFPQDFYEISRQYYMKTKRWDEEEFLLRLQRKSGYYEQRESFLKRFSERYV